MGLGGGGVFLLEAFEALVMMQNTTLKFYGNTPFFIVLRFHTRLWTLLCYTGAVNYKGVRVAFN